MSDVSAQLMAAHETGDKHAMVALYTQAAEMAATGDEAGFFLTHAYIFALELGHVDTPVLRARLVAMGRESL